MGLLNSALQIGRSAILSYEGALHVVGNNISSAGNADYTRISPLLESMQGTPITGELQPGAGVALTNIQRNIDEALESRVRLAIGAQASTSTQQDVLTRVESLFNDLNQGGIGTQLTDFLHGFDELQNTPEDPAIRDLVISHGTNLAQSLRTLRSDLAGVAEDADKQIDEVVKRADQLARDIAKLNTQISSDEAGRQGPAAGLRDQRDGLLRQMAELFDVTVREQPNGTVNVYIGSEALIQGGSVRGLVAVRELTGQGPSRRMAASVRFADTNQQVAVRGGQLEGLIAGRDQHVQIEQIDELAAAIIAEVNRIHADGQGLVGFAAVTGTTDVLDAGAALNTNAAGLPVAPRNGSFFITVADDATATPVSYRIDVKFDGAGDPTTLDSLAADINAAVQGVTASVTTDNRLSLTAGDGFSFTFGYDGQEARADTSGVLAALGLNTFFTGTDAQNIAVNETIVGNPSLIAAASTFLSGDGSNAARLAALDTGGVARLGDLSLPAFYRTVAGAVAVRTAAVRDQDEANASVLTSLQAQRESISGVNLDEEAISLVKFQRAFQGASRFVRAVDDLVAELMTLIR